jgi:hypothetical protein
VWTEPDEGDRHERRRQLPGDGCVFDAYTPHVEKSTVSLDPNLCSASSQGNSRLTFSVQFVQDKTTTENSLTSKAPWHGAAPKIHDTFQPTRKNHAGRKSLGKNGASPQNVRKRVHKTGHENR